MEDKKKEDKEQEQEKKKGKHIILKVTDGVLGSGGKITTVGGK